MKYRFSSIKLVALLLCIALLSSCAKNSAPGTDPVSQSTTSSESGAGSSDSINAGMITNDMISYDNDDYYSDWKSQNPNYLELDGTSARLSGSGAVVDNSKITITALGVYVVSGKLDNGQIIVDVENKGTVRLVLNGAEINCKDSAPIYVKNAGKTVITLQEGTENSVTDGEEYVYSDSAADEPNAAIFSKDNLTLNGTGKLTVNANYNNGIATKDDLKITGGGIYIYSKDDGLIGRDMVLVKDGNITIKANGDGIRSTNDTDASKGFIAIEGGVFDITAGTDGIQAKTSLLVKDGKFTISTGGGSANSSDKVEENMQQPWRKWNGNTTAQSVETQSQSAKALKASSDVTIGGGTFRIDSSDDAIHSNNSITITAGSLSIASGDDGIHADSSVTIKGGTIDITKSYEGIESTLITVLGGDIHVAAKDDGINVSGGNDGSSVNGRPGQNTFNSSGNNKLNINGGYVSVEASGDGLDANGSIYMTGGTVIVNGPTASNNGALDYDGVFEVSGGFLIAAGSAGMAQAPSEQSTQNSIIMNYAKLQQAGYLVHLEDGKGNTMVTFAPEKEYQTVVICSPDVKKDAPYTLYSGGTASGNLLDGLYTGGTYQNGSKVTDFTVSNIVTWLSESGVTDSKSFNQGGANGPGSGGNQMRPGK